MDHELARKFSLSSVLVFRRLCLFDEGFFTPMHQVTVTPVYLLFTVATSSRIKENMVSGSEKLTSVFYPSCFWHNWWNGTEGSCAGFFKKFFYRRLADRLSHQGLMSYSSTLAWIRCTSSFSLLRSATMCIQGTRSTSYRDIYFIYLLSYSSKRGKGGTKRLGLHKGASQKTY